jgi:predicted XRE-type DNA-binding protein
MSQDDLAEVIGVDKAKVSKILHHRIDEFSTDRLVELFQSLNPRMKIKVS